MPAPRQTVRAFYESFGGFLAEVGAGAPTATEAAHALAAEATDEPRARTA